MKIEEFQNKYNIDELLIYENKDWIWSLRPVQITYCSSIISLKRKAEHFSELSDDEFINYGRIIHILEKYLNIFCSPELYNYLSLMLVDKQVHTHVFPRFSDNIESSSKRDIFFPQPVALNSESLSYSVTELSRLRDQISLLI